MESSALARPFPSPLPISHRPITLRSPPSLPFLRSPASISTLRSRPHLRSRHLPPIQASSSSSEPSEVVTSPPPPQPLGAKPLPLLLSLAIGLGVRFLVPKPIEISSQAWNLLSIFLSTIAGLVLSPLPVGAWAFLGLTAAVLTKTLTFAAAFGAFTNEVIWLIVISFFFARGFVKTGLGDRVATYFVKWLGKSTLGLSYGLTISEAMIAPAMPSTTARAGGVFLPIIMSLAIAGGSLPNDSTSRKLGSFLVLSQFQVRSFPSPVVDFLFVKL